MKRLALLLMLVGVLPAYADSPAQHLLACMRASLPPTLQVQRIELTTTQRDGMQRTLKGQLFVERVPDKQGRRLLRATLRINSPEYMDGSAYLIRETAGHRADGMYVYLPSVKRVRKITGTLADGALLGTDFSYADFKQFEGAFGSLVPTKVDSGKFDGRKVEVLSFKGKPGVQSPYSGVRIWVDAAVCMPLKFDFFVDGKLRKRLQAPADAIRKIGKFHYLSELNISDLSKGSHTTLKMRQVSAGSKPEASRFDPASFYLAK